jgi:hypothetical protein
MDPVLKVLYKGQRLENVVYKHFPLLAVFPKSEGFVGRNLPLPIQYGNGGGRSSGFSEAQTYTYSPKFEEFVLTRVSDYATGTIEGEAIEASAADKGSFVRGLKAVVDAKLLECTRSAASALFRDGSGSIGQLKTSGSGIAGATVTLQDIREISNFALDDTIVAAGTKTGALRTMAAANGCHISAINRTAGTLTTDSGNWSAVINDGAFADGDYLFVQGDAQNGGAAKKLSGLDAWVPSSAPGATAFFGVNRLIDTRLGGFRLDASAYSTREESIIDGCSLAAQESSVDINCFVVHPAQFRQLVKELGSKVRYDKLIAQSAKGPMAHIGFSTVILDGDTGPVKVLADRHCPSGYGWGLQMDTWKMNTLGKFPKFLMHDGNRILRQSSADGYEVRVGYRGQIGCDRPGNNINVTMPTL